MKEAYYDCNRDGFYFEDGTQAIIDRSTGKWRKATKEDHENWQNEEQSAIATQKIKRRLKEEYEKRALAPRGQKR